MLVMLAQSAVGLVETYFIGKLGTDALAGVALVFPLLMLMQMMSAGAMGGGISSAIARALGGGRRADADALVAACARYRARLRSRFHSGVARRRPLALRSHGWQRSFAASGADVLRRGFCRRVIGLAVQLARQRDPRHRQYGGAGARHLCRRRRSHSPVAVPDLRTWTVAETRRRRRRGRRRRLLCFGQPRACGLSAVGPQRGPPCFWRHQNSLVVIRRHSSRRPGRGADHGADQSHHRHCHRVCRRFRSGGHCRLWHRLAPGIFAHSAGVRPRRPASRDGRHQYRRRSSASAPCA